MQIICLVVILKFRFGLLTQILGSVGKEDYVLGFMTCGAIILFSLSFSCHFFYLIMSYAHHPLYPFVLYHEHLWWSKRKRRYRHAFNYVLSHVHVWVVQKKIATCNDHLIC